MHEYKETSSLVIKSVISDIGPNQLRGFRLMRANTLDHARFEYNKKENKLFENIIK